MSRGSFARVARTAGRGLRPLSACDPGTAVEEGQRAKRAAPVAAREARGPGARITRTRAIAGGVGGSAAHPSLPESPVTARPDEALAQGAPMDLTQAHIMSNDKGGRLSARAAAAVTWWSLWFSSRVQWCRDRAWLLREAARGARDAEGRAHEQ